MALADNNVDLKIFDEMGKEVYADRVQFKKGVYLFATGKFLNANRIYFVRLKANDKIIFKKLIIQH